MALTDEGSNGIGATMLVGPTGYGAPMMPMYGGGMGGFGNGGDWWGILLLIALLNGGFGGFGGFGGGGVGYDFPWLLNGQQQISNNTNDGFRDAQLHDAVTSVRDGVSNLATQLCGCCGDIQMALANGFAGNVAAITGAQNSLAQQLYTGEIANLNRSFAEQQANQAGFAAVNAGLADAKYTEATEACATRTASAQNTNAIITAITAGIQSIKDDLCADRLEAERRENQNLRTQLSMAQLAASQVEQTAQIRASQATTANQLVSELRACPIPAQPVYGNQAIFSCPQAFNPGCGCGAA